VPDEPSTGTIRHPIFARAYARLSHGMEREIGGRRRDLLAGLAGRVMEVGAGNGLNFRHYPAAVSEVLAVEPEPYLRRLAVAAARDAPVPVEVVDGTAERLRFPDKQVPSPTAPHLLGLARRSAPGSSGRPPD